MEYNQYIQNNKEIYEIILNFFESSEDHDANFDFLIQVMQNQETLKNNFQMLDILNLLANIANNSHQTSNFYVKIEELLNYIIKNHQTTISDSEIFQIYSMNKKILLLLLEKQIIIPNEFILKKIFDMKDFNKFQYRHYLYKGIKPYIDEAKRKEIETEIINNFHEEIETFEEKCEIGENDSYICYLIRQDSIEEFDYYLNKKGIKITYQIAPTIFESNLLLIKRKLSLIKYAAFYGSFQIVQYLKYNNAKLTKGLWLYSIHSSCSELLHFLEENEIYPKDKNYEKIIEETIKCNQNDISNYIRYGLFNQINSYDLDDFIYFTAAKYYNYYFYMDDICDIITNPQNYPKTKICNLIKSITTLTIPSSIHSLGNFSFFNCSFLKQIIIPSSIESIGDYAFYNCKSLEKINIPSSVKNFGKNIFDGIENIEISGDFDKIPNYLFSKCLKLKKIVILAPIKIIEECAFYECSSLTEIKIPSSVIEIEKKAFSGCTSLIQVKFEMPYSLVKIGKYAFDSCKSLKEIEIPSSVNEIEEYAFDRCEKMNKIMINSPVVSIGKYAFNKCFSLQKALIDSSILKIEDNVFNGCSSLEHISIPESVVSIGNYAFIECSSLKEISIPHSVQSIGSGAFYKCTSLAHITIPPSVTEIGDFAFNECPLLNQ